MNKTILDFAMIASVIIGYFISIALIASSFYRSRPNNYLSLSLFIIASLTFFEWPNILTNTIVFQILSNFRLDFLFATTFFTYFLIQIKSKFLSSRWHKWLYLPFFGSVILEISLYFFNLYGSYVDILIFYTKDFASIGFNTFLIFWGRHLIKNSNTISENKKCWLLRLNLFIICVILSWILTRVEFHLFTSQYSFNILRILLSLFLWWVLYYGIFRLQVIVQKEELHDYLISRKKINKQKESNTKKLKATNVSEMIRQLYRLMEEEKLYKNPLLSRFELAAQLGISEGYLSQIINQEINKSVIQFVNEYRIEAAKKLLQNPIFNKYSVEAIGLEAGFKSKSAFYTVFKTSMGISPGAYRKLQKKS